MLLLATVFASTGMAQTNELGIFTNQSSVGQTTPGSTAHYDAAKGEYRITGGGANVWGTSDAFYFVWKKASGDITITADVQWVGTSATEHRKAFVMVRQSLDQDRPTRMRFRTATGLRRYSFAEPPTNRPIRS